MPTIQVAEATPQELAQIRRTYIGYHAFMFLNDEQAENAGDIVLDLMKSGEMTAIQAMEFVSALTLTTRIQSLEKNIASLRGAILIYLFLLFVMFLLIVTK
jgi:hypothetical protein